MSESESIHDYPGVDRLYYFLAHVGMFVVVTIAIMVFGPESGVMEILGLPLMILGLVLDVLRLRNTGLSQWFAFVRFVPFGSMLLAIFLLSAQSGWIETRRWDTTGRNILIVLVALIAVILFMFFQVRELAQLSYWTSSSYRF
ncbi:MAG TPA: hypothetical protein VJV05_01010 [Pyrinomonadaceae bacterium]|nr:hypothetical protein [Pyrinomonadaceae bacterium]